jgi:hypothetical protein
MDDIKGLTPHASRVNGTVPVATIPWRFTYLCWNIPKIRQALSQFVVVSRDLGAAHNDDAGRPRHHQRLDNLVLVGPRDVSEHYPHDFFIIRNEANDRHLTLLPGLRRIKTSVFIEITLVFSHL